MRSLLVLPLVCSLVVVGSAQRASESARGAKPSPQTPPRTAQPAHPPAGFDTIVKPFLAQNCFTCHGKKKQENDLNLQSFDSSASLVEHRDQWDEVVGKLRRGEMPPLEEEQPPEEQRQAVAAWLARELDRIDAATPPDPGRVTARRLNRTEYNNTIKELLGVDVRPADDFPQDDAGYGFDNIADVLSLSPVLMEKYVSAADRVARLALFGPPAMEPTLIRLRSEGRKVHESRTIPASYDVTGLSLPNAFHSMHRVPVDGEYVVRVVLGGLRPKGSDPVTVALWVDEKQIQIATHDQENAASFSTDRQDFGGQAVQMKVRMTAGDHLVSVAIPLIYEGLPARFGGPRPVDRGPNHLWSSRRRPTSLRNDSSSSASGSRIRRPSSRRFRSTASASTPSKSADRTRIERDRRARAWKRSTPAATSTDGTSATCTPRIMTDLARRAFRRPVTTREVEKYIALVRSAQKQEGSFEEGLAVGIQAILVSPDFLFRIERDRPAHGRRHCAAASRRTSWRHACRTFCGRACPTPSCGARLTPARCAIRRSSRSRCGACFATQRLTRSPSSSADSGCSSARSSR